MLGARYSWAILALCAVGSLPAQDLFDYSAGGRLRLHPSDRAVLAGETNRSDLPCRVLPQAPKLGFDLQFTTGYVVRIGSESVSADGMALRIIFRVQPTGQPDLPPIYFRQKFDLPPHDTAASASATLPGRFVVGPGEYKIDWLMRDQGGRVCSWHWTATARMPDAALQLAAAAPQNLVMPFGADTFAEEPPVERDAASSEGLHVSVLVNLAPLDRNRFKLTEYEIESIVGMLRSLHREPSIGLFSLCVFNAYDRQRVYAVRRQTRLDFAALGEAIRSAPAGVVELEDLVDEDGEQRFLSELLNEAMVAGSDRPDAVLILGQKIDRDSRIDEGELQAAIPPQGLFRFSFDRSPHSYPWPGAIESALKPLGVIVSSVTRPQDFGRALAGFVRSIRRSITGNAQMSDIQSSDLATPPQP